MKKSISFKTVVSGILSVIGIAAIVIDVWKDIMPDMLSLPITFVSALTSIYALLSVQVDDAIRTAENKERKHVISNILTAYGINVSQYRPTYFHTEYEPNQLPTDLLYVVSKCLHRSNSVRMIDGINGVSTNYYIYTLSAAHVEKLLGIMTKYLGAMVLDINSKHQSENELHIPIIVVPYGRNVLLCENIANTLGVPILISQGIETSRDKFIPIEAIKDPHEHLYQTFTGVEVLEECIKHTLITSNDAVKKIVFHGIVVDCNITRGSQAISVACYYNDNIALHSAALSKMIMDSFGDIEIYNERNIQIEFQKISDIATLFLADTGSIDLMTKNLRHHGLSANYFFALDETSKEMIYDGKDKILPYLESTPMNITNIKKIINNCRFSRSCSTKNSSIHNLIQTIK